LLYKLLKIYVRLAIHLFCHSIDVDKRWLLQTKGPLLIAANHPNSFLDAILFDILFDIPITSLARGDAFKNKRIFKVLRSLKMLPVYRIREGAENLNTNYDTFDSCIELFKQSEGVLIFSEGLCVNEWHLRPLKKGTARLAFKAWDAAIPLKVLPAGINYSSFRKYGKKVIVHFGDVIEDGNFEGVITDGEKNTQFNNILKERLQPLVYEIDPADKEELNKRFGFTTPIKKYLLAIPALLGALLHVPIYWFAKTIFHLFFSDTDHHDSMMLGILLLTYPFYVLFFSYLCYVACVPWNISALILLPFTAWAYVKYEVRKG
jgi:1-acyl-sn-glycerol-3-phosphate acyltransferase